MSVNAYLTDAMTRHAVFVERFGGGTWRKDIAPIIAKMRDDLASAVVNAQLTEDQLFRVNALIADTDAIVLAATEAMAASFAVSLPAFAEYETEFAQRVLGKVLTVELAGVSVETVAAAATNTTLTLVSGKDVEQLTVRQVLEVFNQRAASDVSTLLRAGAVEGRTSQELARDVRRMVGARTAQQAEALTRTVVASVSAQASRATGAANADVLAGERWTSTLDSRTSLVCAGRDGKVYPIGQGPYPPAHYNCVLPDSRVTPRGRVAFISKRPFDGEIVRIRTAGDKHLAVTPNHPILTERGFVSAKLLQKGDRVVCRLSAYPRTAGGDDDQMETKAEDRFNSAWRSGEMLACPVPLAAKDFHDDVTEEEVGVVLFDRELADAYVTTFAHKFVEGFLKVRGAGGAVGESAARLFDQYVGGHFAATSCGVSFLDDRGALLCGRIIHAGLLLLAAIARGDSVSLEHFHDGVRGDSEPISNAAGTYAGVEQGHTFGDGELLPLRGERRADAGGLERGVDEVTVDAELLRDFRRLLPLAEEFDTVDSVGFEVFTGHVYNLGCEDGVFTANGIVTHNCRSRRIWQVRPEFAVPGFEGTRSSYEGPVSAQSTFGGWLKKQSPAFQDEVLGPERAALFRSGEVSIDRFTDDAGRTLTLEELRAREGLTL